MPISLKIDSQQNQSAFSLNPAVIRDILHFAKPFGHHENGKNLNLGFGFLYYGLVRTIRPKHVMVIGSGYGFSVVCLALALKDNGPGLLSFIDPSYSILKDGPFKTVGGRGQWHDADQVKAHFQRFEVGDIVTHYKMRSDEFFQAYKDLQLPPIDVAFIDGSHAYKDVEYDFLKVWEHAHKNTYIFLHDTNIYIREILHHAGVRRWLKFLKGHGKFFEIIDFPFSSGVALIRVLEPKGWNHLL